MDIGTLSDDSPLCPSAQPEMAGSVVLGIVGGSAAEPQVGYLVESLPATQEVLAVASSVKPTEVFRFAAPCAGVHCQHFDGVDCRLARRVVHLLPAVVERLPACSIRPNCRWWLQEGKAACLRCPQIVTEVCHPSELLRQAADPESTGRPQASPR